TDRKMTRRKVPSSAARQPRPLQAELRKVRAPAITAATKAAATTKTAATRKRLSKILNPRNGSSGIKKGASSKATRNHPTTTIVFTVPCRQSVPVQETTIITAIITTTATIITTAAKKAAGA